MPDPAPARATQRCTLAIDPAEAELASARLWTAGAIGVWERPSELVAWFVGEPTAPLPPGSVLTEEPDHDWQAAWKATIEPVGAGRFCVVPTWLASDHVPAEGELTLVLDPGRAFGSGHHATTTLCLKLLDDLDRRAGVVGRTLADVGCGSGILAIGAARLGARAVGVDLDPDAVAVTGENATRNQVHVPTAVGSAADAVALLGGAADVVAANLVTDTVAELAEDLVALARPGGHLVVSGIAADRADVAIDPLREAGLAIDDRRERDGWVAVLGTRELASTAPSDGVSRSAPTVG